MNYDVMWSEMVRYLQNDEGDKAREVWDKVVEKAWKYDELIK